ncbi:hypothetical protein WJX72_008934 [[Myrmecia] bisecta]|uniref:Uncharacterized protein n=1 Tax=[Myrmecia] bisecta TaxID=41462 RepID=A0AAW1Q1I4_9CHLO
MTEANFEDTLAKHQARDAEAQEALTAAVASPDDEELTRDKLPDIPKKAKHALFMHLNETVVHFQDIAHSNCHFLEEHKHDLTGDGKSPRAWEDAVTTLLAKTTDDIQVRIESEYRKAWKVIKNISDAAGRHAATHLFQNGWDVAVRPVYYANIRALREIDAAALLSYLALARLFDVEYKESAFSAVN